MNGVVLAGTLWVFVRRGWKIEGHEGDGVGRFLW